MWGAVIGDIAGSIYEYGQLKKVEQVNVTEIIPKDGFFSDDTILTVAILDAIENDKNYEKYLKQYGEKYIDYKPKVTPYFKTSFSPGFIKWINGNSEGESVGNGAMMRISPVGYMFNSEQEIIRNVRLATIPSHNTTEAVRCSDTNACIVGSMAEAMYGINLELIEQVKKKIPKEFTQVLERAYRNKKYDLEDFER